MIERQAQSLQAATRQARWRSLAVPALIIGVSGFVFLVTHQLLPKAACVAALLWSLAGQYRLQRALSPTSEASATGLHSYRLEVRRHQTLVANQLRWTLAPTVLALAVLATILVRLALHQGRLPNLLPFLTLLTIWVIAVFIVRLRDQLALKREIDQLNDLERANHAQP